MIHGHEIDPPDELPCRECWDRVHRPRARAIISDILNEILDDPPKARSHTTAARNAQWFKGFAACLDAAYEETVSREEWTTCSSCASEARADAARE